MNLKIDTKEKFYEIDLQNQHLSANMTADLVKLLSDLRQEPPFNVVLSLSAVQQIDLEFAQQLVAAQSEFYENSRSFVICGLQQAVEKNLDEMELLELMNVTPTLSEAWDIVQMEEIERELLDGLE